MTSAGRQLVDRLDTTVVGRRRELELVVAALAGRRHVLLEGPPGTGKSTMMHLLQRLYDADDGQITIGGVDIRKIQKAHLRSRIGLILQEPFHYSRSLQDNIRIAAPHDPWQTME